MKELTKLRGKSARVVMPPEDLEMLNIEFLSDNGVQLIDMVCFGVPLINDFFVSFEIFSKFFIHPRQIIITCWQQLQVQV